MSTLLQVLGSFLFATLLGSLFVQRIQHLNWLRQQQVANKEKTASQLRTLYVEFDQLLNRRLYRTRRLLYALRRPTAEKVDLAAGKYDDVLADWNEKRNSLYVQLARVVRADLAQDFDVRIAEALVRIGQRLEKYLRMYRAGTDVKSARGDLRSLKSN